jgi:hypothetical protein
MGYILSCWGEGWSDGSVVTCLLPAFGSEGMTDYGSAPLRAPPSSQSR